MLSSRPNVRPPAVAGTFYPASRGALAAEVDAHLDRARAQLVRGGAERAPVPKAIVVPHAGYVYSGAVAAKAFVRLEPARERVTRVVLVGPAHRVWVDGLVAPEAHLLRTPLGEVEVDEGALAGVATTVPRDARAHAAEHSLEVELPFLQRVLPRAQVVPLAVGGATPAEVARALEELWGGEETVVVVSSDLSHYLPYSVGRAEDERTCARILSLEGPVASEQACGAAGINGLLEVARARGLRTELLDLKSSGDTAGPRDEVVGYAALAFHEPGSELERRATILARHARAAIRQDPGGESPPPLEEAWAKEDGATFVTLRWTNEELQGCIGRLEPERPIAEDTAANAVAAATLDPRATKLGLADLVDLDVEVSILSPLEPLDVSTEEEAVRALRPGTDGVVLARGRRRATFLPSMWPVFHDAATLLRELKDKAGFPVEGWHDDYRVLRYTVTKSTDPAPSRVWSRSASPS